MGSGGGGNSGGGTSTTTTNLPAWLQPYATQFIEAYKNQAIDPNTGGPIQQPSGLNQQVAGFTPDQLNAMSGIEGLVPAEQGLANMGGGLSAATIGGAYLNPASNPYLQSTFNNAAGDVINAYQTATAPSTMATFQRAGQFGSSAMNEQQQLDQYGLGQNLQNLAANIYGTNYSNERQNQLATMNALPTTLSTLNQPQTTLMGIGALQQQQNQTGLDTSYANAVNSAQWPFAILSGYGGALGQAGSGAGTSTTSVNQKSSGGK